MEICWPCWNSRESWVCYDGFPQNSLVRHHFPTFSPLKLQLFHLCPIFSQFFSYVFNMCHVPIVFLYFSSIFPAEMAVSFTCAQDLHILHHISIYIYVYYSTVFLYIYTHIYISVYFSCGPLKWLLVPQISEGFLWAPGSICCSC